MNQYQRALIFCTCDPLHYGHIRFFKRAKEMSRRVYAVTECDEIIRDYKHREPFTSERERLEDLWGIKYLDAVYMRDYEHNREYWVQRIEPNVLFVGEDWRDKDWEGAKLGIPVVYLPRTEGITSTYLRAAHGLGISEYQPL